MSMWSPSTPTSTATPTPHTGVKHRHADCIHRRSRHAGWPRQVRRAAQPARPAPGICTQTRQVKSSCGVIHCRGHRRCRLPTANTLPWPPCVGAAPKGPSFDCWPGHTPGAHIIQQHKAPDHFGSSEPYHLTPWCGRSTAWTPDTEISAW